MRRSDQVLDDVSLEGIPQTMSQEETVFVDSPSMFRNHPFGFVVSLLLCLVVVGIPILIVWYFRARATELTITDKRTRLHRGLLSRSITEVWHRDVRNVQLDQTFLQRILDTGRIGISSAAQAGIEIDVCGMRSPDKIKNLIDGYRAKAD